MSDTLPIGEPVILPPSVPVDEIGRPVITPDQRQQIRDTLLLIPDDAKAALLVFGDMQEARANFAWKVGKGWTVAAGAGFVYRGAKPKAFVSLGKVWK